MTFPLFLCFLRGGVCRRSLDPSYFSEKIFFFTFLQTLTSLLFLRDFLFCIITVTVWVCSISTYRVYLLEHNMLVLSVA